MSFSEVIQNLAIGIAGGIFSGIIVSVVFYLLSQYQNELDLAKKMIYPFYEITIYDNKETTEMLKKKEEENDLPKNFRSNRIKHAMNEVEMNFSTFEPWKFNYELKETMLEINQTIQDGKYYGKEEFNKEKLSEFMEIINAQLSKIQKFEKEFLKYFFKRLIKNKIIIATGIIFISIVIIA